MSSRSISLILTCSIMIVLNMQKWCSKRVIMILIVEWISKRNRVFTVKFIFFVKNMRREISTLFGIILTALILKDIYNLYLEVYRREYCEPAIFYKEKKNYFRTSDSYSLIILCSAKETFHYQLVHF